MSKKIFLSFGLNKVAGSEVTLLDFDGHQISVVGRKRLSVAVPGRFAT